MHRTGKIMIAATRDSFLLFLFITQVVCNNVNEPPTFEAGGYPMGLPLAENTPVGSEVFILKGHDPEGSPVKYGIQLTNKFSVDEHTGVVKLSEPLDREEVDTIRFRVTLEDSVSLGQQPNIVGVEAYIIVLDENDNPPQFIGTPYEAIVPEDAAPGTSILPAIRVTDSDLLGDNIQVDCVPQPQFPDACTKFKIIDIEKSQDTYIGALVLQRPLDYKERPFYQLVLRASDGSNSNTTGVEIKVADVQNNPPEFLDSLTGVVKEDDPIGTLVMVVKARDGDRGMPRKIAYELVTNPMDYFLLDQLTGELRTAKPLDREALDNSTGVLTFVVKAREIVDGQPADDEHSVSTIEATVTIKDVNDEPPTFNQKEYAVSIPENIANGTPLPHLNMIIRDPDIGLNSVFSLRLEDITGAFSVEPSQATGSTSVNIRVTNGSFDYENPNQRKFIVLVVAEEVHTHQKLSSTATVTVDITDINDNAPYFSSSSYSALVSEIAESGTPIITITAKDRDSGRFGASGIVYQLIGRGSEHFVVDKKYGSISVAPCKTPGRSPCLDYEEQHEYFLNFKATDDKGNGQTTSVSLRISLTDANDSPPQFLQKQYRAVIDEGSEKFEPPLKVEARDPDKSSKITYSLAQSNESGLFDIDADSGEITIAKISKSDVYSNLKAGTIELTVRASDGLFIDECLLSVNVRDVNNNAPVFLQDHYMASVSELVKPGSLVKELSATDADDGLNAEVVYRIQRGAFNDFIVNETNGAVLVARKLDYDIRSTYHVEVVAFDKGSPSLTGTSTLVINVENSNDKPPYFVPEIQRAEVTEDTPIGTVFAVLKAVDPDISEPDALNFVMTEPITAIDRSGRRVQDNSATAAYKDFFAVDRKTGQVSVVKSLDRDVAATISISVLVTDTSAPMLQQARGLLIVTIIDLNRFAPQFVRPWSRTDPRYSIEMQEEQPVGATVCAFGATDEDNAIAGYAIEPPNPYFQIDNVTGIVRTRKVIDYEKTKQLDFTIVAYDTGVPRLSASAHVFVTIVNINDESPKFEKESYVSEVEENSPPGTRVVIVKAVDKDEGTFGQITYNLVGQRASDFTIDPKTGEISVGKATVLDREVMPEFSITAMASDNAPAHLRRETSVPVLIKLNDVNDNRPIFNQHNYRASVAENLSTHPPAPIFQVRATDNDEGLNGKVRYKIIKGNDDGSFVLNPETGILYPAVSLLGRAQFYELKVEARDRDGKGPYSDVCNIYVRIIPVNQYKPEFIMPESPNATVEVPENSGEPNYLVMTVKAIDRDAGDNGKISYHLKVGNRNLQESEEFVINRETGELRSKIMLDREAKSKIELVLVAADHGSPTSYETLRLLTIVLLDTNDNAPEFCEEYSFSVPENRPKNYYVGKVNAEDKDEGRHAKVYYYIKSGHQGHNFHIDKSDGSIYTNNSFDREKRSSYRLTIVAANDPDLYIDPRDNEHPRKNQQHGYVNVTINILDENDNPPTFEKSIYYAGINMMANLNELVTKITASDIDLGDNGTVQYYVASSNLYKYESQKSSGSIVPSPFNVSQDGKLVTSGYMAEYNQDRFIVEVVAKEVAFPERFAVTKVHVWVYEPSQLIKIVFSSPPEKVLQQKDETVQHLSDVTQSRVVVDDIRYHVDASGHIRREWCDMYVHVVDQKTQIISPVAQMLKLIDSKYDFLKNYYAGLAIESILPAHVGVQEGSFDVALAALIALLIILSVGCITITAVCCCLKNWVISVPNDIRKKEGLIKKQIIEELNTTENPLWIEQKMKLYEEQELTMQVFSEPETGLVDRRGSNMSLGIGDTSQDNTYATIQHPLPTNRHRSSTPDYTTLPGNRNMYESAMGFQGSTFQPVISSQMILDNEEQPQFVSGLV
ncbi:hypothetical protein TKK_0001717 [Trichogramma kaykai]